MEISTELPKECQPCETCGHIQNPTRRYGWLAGCSDGHDVHSFFELSWLEQRFAHTWPDRTYSAIRLPQFKVDDDLILQWLEAVHAGQTSRRQFEIGAEIVYDSPIMHQHVDPATGDTTVTYSFPSPDEKGVI